MALAQLNRVREAVAVVDNARKVVPPASWSRLRYPAARVYAWAGCGRQDAAQLDAGERTRLRKAALGWLREELVTWDVLAGKKAAPQLRRQAADNVRRLLGDDAFAGVRDTRALAELPTNERRDWQALWNDARNVLAQAER
jgi:hypothetical protein